jgi:DNA-binding protein YbaB
MDERILDPDGARERLNAWKGRIDKLAADTQLMSERMQSVRVTASDPDGMAEVTVDSTGALAGLRLTDRIQRVPPAVVSQAVMAALREAKSKLADRSREIIADTVGAESPVGKAIVESVGRQLRDSPAPERVAPRDDDGEGYDNRSYLRGT